MKKFATCILFMLIFKINTFAAIAVFPFEDLSKDLNGLDMKISTLVADKLIDFGYDVVYPMEIIFFLERKNIPYTGWIDSLTAKEISKIFRCNLILLGTIIEMDRLNSNFILSLRIFSIKDNRLIWGNTSTISKSQQISILDIRHRTFKQLLSDTITKVLKKVPEPVMAKAFPKPDFDIDNIFINPKYSHAGDEITCRVKLKFSGRRPDKIFLFVEGKKIKITPVKNVITYKFKAPDMEKRYSISISGEWGKPFYFSKKIFLTSFYVDNTPPEFKIKLKFATVINNKIFFNKFLKIIPILKKEEKISKWEFKIISRPDNNTITIIRNRGNLPKFFLWKGITSKGAILPNGEYSIILKIFDMANNEFEKLFNVYLVKTILPPQISAFYLKNSKKIVINFSYKPHLVQINFMRVEIFDKDGNLIASKESKSIIKKFEFFNKNKLNNFLYSLELKDILGNRLFLKKRKIKLREKEQKKKKSKKIWLNEF